jgi:hypothetical protein
MKIYLDFDGTVVEHKYPEMGRCNFGCMEVIKKLQDAGHTIILNTYRADCNDGSLDKALSLLNDHSYHLFVDKNNELGLKPITECTESKITPWDWNWNRHLAVNEIFIDDIAPGIPLKPCVMISGMMVDWDELDRQFIKHGLYAL